MRIIETTRADLINELIEKQCELFDDYDTDVWEQIRGFLRHGVRGFNDMNDGELMKLAIEQDIYANDEDDEYRIKIISHYVKTNNNKESKES